MSEGLMYFIIAVLALFIQYMIIRYASGAPKRREQLHLQNQILLHIAKKLGVEQERLQSMEEDNTP